MRVDMFEWAWHVCAGQVLFSEGFPRRIALSLSRAIASLVKATENVMVSGTVPYT